jgi:SnoaL-like polyketide cyclase
MDPPAPPECPIKTAVENTVIAQAWHEDVINRRNPAILQDILASDVVHHAAGGYPKVMDATGIAAMMAEFLTAFPDLRYTFDQNPPANFATAEITSFIAYLNRTN